MILQFLFCLFTVFTLGSGDESISHKASSLVLEADNKIKEQNYESAIQLFSQAIELIENQIQESETVVTDYSWITWKYQRANLYQIRNKNVLALRDLNSVLEYKPEHHSARLKRGKLLIKLGKFEEAEEDLNLYLKHKPGHESTIQDLEIIKKSLKYQTEARNLMEKQDYKNAISSWTELLALSPNLVEGRLGRAKCLFLEAKYSEVLKDTSEVLKVTGENSDALYMRGMAFYYLDQPDASITIFQQALKSDPDNSKIRKEWKKIRKLQNALKDGEEFFENKKFKEALEQFEIAKKADPENTLIVEKVILKECQSLVELKEYDKAIEKCTESLNYNEELSLIQLGETYLQKGDYINAQKHFDKARSINPNSSAASDGSRRSARAKKMAERVDFYKILEVPKDAHPNLIKRAYRKKAILYHPDKIKEGENEKEKEKLFIQLTEAYETLVDPERRRKYDSGEDLDEGFGNMRQNPFTGGGFQFFSQGFNFHF